MIETAVQFLLKTQNPDGGWGSEKERRSNTEATAFAIMALSSLGDRSLVKSIDQGLNWLTHRQHSDGSWPLTAQLKEGSWTTALAILCLAIFETHRQRALRGADWLLRQEGKAGWINSLLYRWVPQMWPAQVNPDLKGWSWTTGTFSWVEPTAYALICLKKLRPYLQETQAEERIHQGELMLYDRACESGGWNPGPCKILGETLSPYPDITALALIALQDLQAAEVNQRSLQSLRKMLTQVESGLTLSWSILCLSLYGEDVDGWRKILARNFPRTELLGETKSIALGLLASTDGARVIRV